MPMSAKENGMSGAFPTPSVYCGPDGVEADAGWPGMTLREWFAGMALQGILACKHFTDDGAARNPALAAQKAVELADAVLDALAKPA